MTRDLFAVAPDTALGAIAQLFDLHGCSTVPIVDDAGRPLGIVRRSDLKPCGGAPTSRGSRIYYRFWNGEPRVVGRIADRGHAGAGVAADVMVTHLCTVEPTTELDAAIERMAAAGLASLLVVDEGRLVGLLEAASCLRPLAG